MTNRQKPKSQETLVQIPESRRQKITKHQDFGSVDYLLRGDQIFGPDGYLPISRSTFYDKIKQGDLPPPIKLGPRISCWRKSDITAFIEKMELSND